MNIHMLESTLAKLWKLQGQSYHWVLECGYFLARRGASFLESLNVKHSLGQIFYMWVTYICFYTPLYSLENRANCIIKHKIGGKIYAYNSKPQALWNIDTKRGSVAVYTSGSYRVVTLKLQISSWAFYAQIRSTFMNIIVCLLVIICVHICWVYTQECNYWLILFFHPNWHHQSK